MGIRKLLQVLAAAFATAAGAQDSPPPQRSGVSRADLFIASFGPLGSEQGLRTSDLGPSRFRNETQSATNRVQFSINRSGSPCSSPN